ncbi:MAG: oligosaccharide flippase family protein [Candidatus Moraniibacteriota bacterium]
MMMVLRGKITMLVEMIHLRVFGHEMSHEMRQFLDNLSWSFFGGISASTLMLLVNIAVGRYFGPEEYGKYNLVLSLSQILLVFIFCGTDISSIKFLSSEKKFSDKKIYLSSSLYFIVAITAFFWSIYFFIFSGTEFFFGLEKQYIFLALLLGSVLSIKGIVDGYLRAYAFFRFQAVLRIIEAIFIVTLLYSILNEFSVREYRYYIYAIIGGAIVFSLMSFFRLRENFGIFKWSYLRSMLLYGNVILLGTIFGTAFNLLDKIIITKYLGVAQLGIYSAYFMTSTNLIAQLTQVFNNVFFPAISQMTDASYITKINIAIKWLSIPGGVIVSFVLYVILLIFGDAYEPNVLLAVGFGFLSILQIILTINASIITALSKELLKRYYLWLYGVITCHLFFYGIFIYIEFITIPSILVLFFVNFSVVVYIQKILIVNFVQKMQ